MKNHPSTLDVRNYIVSTTPLNLNFTPNQLQPKGFVNMLFWSTLHCFGCTGFLKPLLTHALLLNFTKLIEVDSLKATNLILGLHLMVL